MRHTTDWTSIMAAGALALAAAPHATAGPYSGGLQDDANPHDPGIPGFVGPDGPGKCGTAGPNNSVNPLFQQWAAGFFDYRPADNAWSGAWDDPVRALGPVSSNNLDTVSLGELDPGELASNKPPGEITFSFNRPAVDGPGPDLTVFENGFGTAGGIFADLGYVEVSTDGRRFARFPSDSLTAGPVGAYGVVDPTDVFNLVGKHVNGLGDCWGTPFDLGDLAADPLVLSGAVDLGNINYVRVVDTPGSGVFTDATGNPVYDPWPTAGSGGVDIEAVGLIHTADAACWSQFHGSGADHAGHWEGPAAAVRPLWSAGTGLHRPTQPAVSTDGALVFAYGENTHPEGTLTAFDATSGRAVWSTNVRSQVSYDSWSSPVYYGGYVYWAGGPAPASVYKLNATNGSWSAADGGWTVELPGTIVDASPTVAAGHLYITTYGGFDPAQATHYCLGLEDGTVQWSRPDGGQGQGAMAYDAARNRVYQTIYTNFMHYLRAYDASDGSIAWTADWGMGPGSFGLPFQCGIAYAGDRIVLQDYRFEGNGTLHVASATNGGAAVWHAPTPLSGDGCPAVDPDGNVYVYGNWLGAGQTRAYDAAGNILWTSSLGGGWEGSPAWAAGHVFAGDQSANHLYVLDDADGSMVYDLAGSGPVAFGRNTFYSIGHDGVLYAYVLMAPIEPHVQANSSDGPLAVPASEVLTITVALEDGGFTGEPVDWWVVVVTPLVPPYDLFYYNLLGDSWEPGLVATATSPVGDLAPPFTVFDAAGLPAGPYTFYFGVDLAPNGLLDVGDLVYDTVEVTVTP